MVVSVVEASLCVGVPRGFVGGWEPPFESFVEIRLESEAYGHRGVLRVGAWKEPDDRRLVGENVGNSGAVDGGNPVICGGVTPEGVATWKKCHHVFRSRGSFVEVANVDASFAGIFQE